MQRKLLSVLALVLVACQTTSTEPLSAFEDARLDTVTYEGFEKFRNENEFRDYLKDVEGLAKKRDMYWAENGYTLLAQADECVDDSCMDDEVVVTGSKRSSSSSSSNITNVQTQGVDEGDIVKQIGDYLIVLQDGRLFSVNMGDRPGSMKYVDRHNVYSDSDSDTWYDEVLVFENRILVTGYSYDEEGTELSVVDLLPNGQFERVATFFISSDDYYDPENYATRIVDGKLVIYTPLYLTEVGSWDELEWPVIRRWVDEDAWEDRIDDAFDSDNDDQATSLESRLEKLIKGRNLFNARNIYKPVQRTAAPVVHSVSVCDLEAPSIDEPLACKNTAFVGPERQELYVSNEDVYMWIGPGWDDVTEPEDECDATFKADIKNSVPSAFYKLPLSGGAPKAVLVNGQPINQFSFETFGNNFRAVLNLESTECERDWDKGHNLAVLDFPLSKFSRTPRQLSKSYQSLLPEIGTNKYENRVTDTHAYIGTRESWSSLPPGINEDELMNVSGTLLAHDFSTDLTSKIDMPHNIIRLERIENDMVATGYKNKLGLSLSYISGNDFDFGTITLPGHFESEGRSHAFNYDDERGGKRTIGLPTVKLDFDSKRWWWRSEQSDVSFLSVNRGELKVDSLGRLKALEDSVHEDYECDVSCIDWYGNSRPVFTKGRVFALSGTELIEGQISSGRIFERQRLNLSAPLTLDEPIGEAFSP